MTDNWAIEVRNKAGFVVFDRQVVTAEEIADRILSTLEKEGTGGIVIYRSTVAESNECETDEIEGEMTTPPGTTILLNPQQRKLYDAEMEKRYNPSRWCSDCGQSHRSNEPHLPPVASGNEEVVVGAMDYWPADTPKGHCKTCGCPPEAMPMINRGTGWCCEAHRKEQL